MDPEMVERLQLLARMLLDARIAAGSVTARAVELKRSVDEFNVMFELGVMRERVKQLLELEERRPD